MVWDCISFYGVGPLLFLSGKQDFWKYCETLTTGLLPIAAETFGESVPWMFQHYGAAIHTSQEVRFWMASKNISVIQWPAKSSDVNIIENV